MSLIRGATAGGFSFSVKQISVNVNENGLRYLVSWNLSDQQKLSEAPVEQAMLILSELVAQHWGYIGFCDKKKFGCGKYFRKTRIDREYCSKTCVNRATTYRQRGKEPAA